MKASVPILLAVAAAAASAVADTPVAAVNPYTYLGRVMDAEHVAFDAERVATVSACAPDGTLLAATKTFFRSTSRNNYVLDVPVATKDVSGNVQVGDVIVVSVEDDFGVNWAGVVVDPGRESGTVVGKPGGTKEMDIVLMKDADGDGFDDALVANLRAGWAYLRARGKLPESAGDGDFDLDVDCDGDGVSTRMEILAGTDPFSADSVLRITAFDQVSGVGEAAGENAFALDFPVVYGHAYSLESAQRPDGGWAPVQFRTEAGAVPVNVISNDERGERVQTVFLAPVEGPAAFFRVKVE